MEQLMSPREDKWGFMKLQNCILNIAKYIDEFCEANNIHYCLMGGSALGAVRHQGFIPWDDDLDIFMRPQDYAKFRELFNSKGDRKTYYLQEWGNTNGTPSYAKLRMNKSAYIEADFEKLDIHKGVYVDIFILHTCPDNIFKRYNQFLWARYLVVKSLATRDYSRRTKFQATILRILRMFPTKFLVNYALKQVYKYQKYPSKYFCHFLGRAGLTKGLYPRKYFEDYKRVPFEKISLCVPYCVEDYLHDRWGDYMKIPSEDEIKHYQHSSGWSDSKPFKGYNEDGIYKDEKNLIV